MVRLVYALVVIALRGIYLLTHIHRHGVAEDLAAANSRELEREKDVIFFVVFICAYNLTHKCDPKGHFGLKTSRLAVRHIPVLCLYNFRERKKGV